MVFETAYCSLMQILYLIPTVPITVVTCEPKEGIQSRLKSKLPYPRKSLTPRQKHGSDLIGDDPGERPREAVAKTPCTLAAR